MQPDIIILSNSKTIEKYGLTQRAINSLRLSENFKFNEIIIETNTKYLQQGFIYQGSTVITPNEEFNYNRFLNIGLNYCKSDWIIISNNDVIFTEKWFTKIMNFSKQHPEFLSFSPWEPNWHKVRGMVPDRECYEGYRTSYEVTGWCIVLHRSILEKCKLFDEDFKFWYQDNDYAASLEHYGVRHGLIVNSRVYHDVSKSLDLLAKEKLHDMTDGQHQVFCNKWGNNK